MAKKIKTANVTDVIKVTQEIGDVLSTQYHTSKDLKVKCDVFLSLKSIRELKLHSI